MHSGFLHLFVIGFPDRRQIHVLEDKRTVQGIPIVNLRQNAAREGSVPDGSHHLVHNHPLRGNQHFPLCPSEIQRGSQQGIAHAPGGSVKADATLHQLHVIPHRKHATAGKRYGPGKDKLLQNPGGTIRKHLQGIAGIGLSFQAKHFHRILHKTEIYALGLERAFRRTSGQSGGRQVISVGNHSRHIGQHQLIRHQMGIRPGGLQVHPPVARVGCRNSSLQVVSLFQIVQTQCSLEGKLQAGILAEDKAVHEKVVILHAQQLVYRLQRNCGLPHHKHLTVQKTVGEQFKDTLFHFHPAVLHKKLVGTVFRFHIRHFDRNLVPGKILRMDACAD